MRNDFQKPLLLFSDLINAFVHHLIFTTGSAHLSSDIKRNLSINFASNNHIEVRKTGEKIQDEESLKSTS